MHHSEYVFPIAHSIVRHVVSSIKKAAEERSKAFDFMSNENSREKDPFDLNRHLPKENKRKGKKRTKVFKPGSLWLKTSLVEFVREVLNMMWGTKGSNLAIQQITKQPSTLFTHAKQTLPPQGFTVHLRKGCPNISGGASDMSSRTDAMFTALHFVFFCNFLAIKC